MKLSLNWLKEFVKFKQAPEKVAEILTLGGFEVERIDYWGQGLEQVIVGQIKTIVNHAEADKLSVCKVDIGKKQLLNIVCGARNIKPEQKVPVALVGATLPSGLKIERRRIRGVDSEGMLCAEDELKLGDDHKGILILSKDLPLGQPLGKVIGLADTVLDVTVPANRSDCLSIIGLAREFAALSGLKFIQKKVAVRENKKYPIQKSVAVRVADDDLCPKYTARVVRNVKVRQSPDWLKSRLLLSGIKPVNNIVDITNYVMLETGQPLHAFDVAKVKGKKIVVRKAGPDTMFNTLDGEPRKLSAEMLVIADSKEPIAVAGVMGGANSEITRETKDVVIESAIFKPVSIRKTRQALGLVTEASLRFERGIQWGLPEAASDRASQLMSEMAGGEVAKGTIIVSKIKDRKPAAVSISLTQINRLVGRDFTGSEVRNILERLSFKAVETGKGTFKVTAPAWRLDIGLPADVVEEVGRVFGWNSLKPAPMYAALTPMALPTEKYWERKIKDTLVACGMTEVLNYSFYSQEFADLFLLDISEHFEVTNPLNPDQKYLRTSLMPRLIDNVINNYHSKKEIQLFEIGHVFNKKYQERELNRVAGIVFNKENTPDNHLSRKRLNELLSTLFYQLNISIDRVQYFDAKDEGLTKKIRVNNKRIGSFGWVMFSRGKLGSNAVWFEIDLPKLLEHVKIVRSYSVLTRFPSIERDMSFVMAADSTDYYTFVDALRQIDPLITAVEPVDLHKLSDTQRSATVRIVYQAPDRTLKSEEVEAIEKEIILTMRQTFKAELKK